MEIHYDQLAAQAVGVLAGAALSGAKEWTSGKVKELLELIRTKFHRQKREEGALEQFVAKPSEANHRILVGVLKKAMEEDREFAAQVLRHVNDVSTVSHNVTSQNVSIKGNNTGNISQIANIGGSQSHPS